MKRAHQNNFRKIFLLIAIAAISFTSKAQPAAYADPAVGSFDITTTTDVSVNANTLLSNTVYKLKLLVFNLDQANPIPEGTCVIQIGLGTKMKVDPAFNLALADYNNYFSWSTFLISGQWQIAGFLIAPLPANFFGQLSFNVRALSPATQGPSLFTGNFSVSQNNPNYNFSDLNPNNNIASLSYQMAAQLPLPVDIVKFGAVNKNCKINVNWTSENELNLSRYEVEMSKDGITYYNVATVIARNSTNYSVTVDIPDFLKAPVLYVRLICVDHDGSYKYSSIVTVAGNCGVKSSGIVYGYPNPVNRSSAFMTVGIRDGIFNGSYQLVLSDISGKVYQVKDVNLNNVISFRYDLVTLTAPGKYFLSIRNTETGEKSLVQFEKL